MGLIWEGDGEMRIGVLIIPLSVVDDCHVVLKAQDWVWLSFVDARVTAALALSKEEIVKDEGP